MRLSSGTGEQLSATFAIGDSSAAHPPAFFFGKHSMELDDGRDWARWNVSEPEHDVAAFGFLTHSDVVFVAELDAELKEKRENESKI